MNAALSDSVLNRNKNESTSLSQTSRDYATSNTRQHRVPFLTLIMMSVEVLLYVHKKTL